MKVAFVHPDLGIGGAERLVVDCALALQNKGHDVIIYTSHHDKSHAFDETVDGTIKVKVLGDTFPRHVAGKLAIFCAIARQLHLTFSLMKEPEVDVFIVDQLSACVPYIRLLKPEARILFYCHHPDLKLTERTNLLKKMYRLPFDQFEKWTTAKSDQIVVNSEYTRKIYFESFGKDMPDPSVLYPVVDPKAVVLTDSKLQKLSTDPEFSLMEQKISTYFDTTNRKLLLSINRFERKKNIELAIESFSTILHARTELRENVLIVAGGYDLRVTENIEYLKELEALCKKFRVPSAVKFPTDSWSTVDFEKTRVLFMPSMTSSEKSYLLKKSSLLLYTPTNEHFGIVPLESMIAETPVLATNTGGPLETIVDGKTGFLRKSDVDDWYLVLVDVLSKMSAKDLAEMGKQGRAHVESEFTLKNMEPLLHNLVLKTKETEHKNEDKVATNTLMVSFAITMSSVLFTLFILFVVDFVLWILPILADSLQW